MTEIKVSAEWLAQEREANAIRKDISTAYKIIYDGLVRYKKKMLHARSKKQSEDLSVFAELDGYSSLLEIQEDYGYGVINEERYDRLRDLWAARENKVNSDGKFEDRVSQMLERAMHNLGDPYMDKLIDYDDMKRQDEQVRLRIETENSINNNKRYQAGL